MSGGSRSRGRRSRSSGDGTDRRAKSAPEEGLLLLTALRVVGGGAVARPQIRLRMTELTLLLPVPGMRLEVRILVALPGMLTARLVLGRRCLLQGMSFASLERVVVRLDLRVWRMLTAPLPSRGFTWREVAWAAFQSPIASSRRSGGSPVLLVSRFWAGFFHPLLGAPLLGRLSVVPTTWLTAVSLACGLAFAVFLAVAGIVGCRFSSPSGVEVGSFSYTLAFSRLTSVLSRCQILAWLVSWGRWLVLGRCLCLASTRSAWSCLLLLEAVSPFRRWCRSSFLAMLGTDLVLFLALRARLASLSVAVLTCCLLVGIVASLVEVFSGMLLGRLRRPGVPPRGLRLVFRFVRSPRLLLLEFFCLVQVQAVAALAGLLFGSSCACLVSSGTAASRMLTVVLALGGAEWMFAFGRSSSSVSTLLLASLMGG